MTVLLAGGTSRLGHRLAPRLRAHGLTVRVFTRDPRRAADLGAGVEIAIGDVRDSASVRAAMVGVETVVSAVHGLVGPRGISPATVDRNGNRNLVDAAQAVGADLVLLSVAGASPDHPLELFRMKYAAERYALGCGVPTTVVRPTAFMELWIEVLRKMSGRSGRPLILGRGDNPINFVSVVDVAELVAVVVMDPSMRGTVVEIGGPENLTLNDMSRALQSADGGDAAARHVPRLALRVAAATVGRVAPHFGRMARGALVMDRIDLSFDAAPFRRAYPQVPTTSLSEVLAATRDAPRSVQPIGALQG